MTDSAASDLIVIGCGYLGKRVVARMSDEAITLFTRSSANAATFASQGFRPVVGDVLDAGSLEALPTAPRALYAVGFDRQQGVSREAVTLRGLKNALDALSERVHDLVYVSSTSVYGQTDGSFVDEDSLTEPESENGRLACQAEELVRNTELRQSGRRPVILRLAGIYGPSRMLARSEQLRAGTPMRGSGQAFLNLIHVEDAATTVTVVLNSDVSDRTFVVCDDEPVRRADYYGELAKRLGAPPPSFDPSQPGPRSAGLNKRCRNQRLREELGVILRYPTFRHGLEDVVRSAADE